MPAFDLLAERKIVEAARKGEKKLSLLGARVEARYFRKIVRKLER